MELYRGTVVTNPSYSNNTVGMLLMLIKAVTQHAPMIGKIKIHMYNAAAPANCKGSMCTAHSEISDHYIIKKNYSNVNKEKPSIVKHSYR